MPAASDPRDRPIGVFDSGVGGLTVLHELLVSLPNEDFLYFGDDARFPYGPRTAEDLELIGLSVVETLLEYQVKLLVVACNSMTAAALPVLRRRMQETTLGVDVIGVVAPEAVQAVAATRTGRIGLLATEATVASGAYAKALAAVDPHVDLVAVPCPDLASMIQEPPSGELFTRELELLVRRYCEPLISTRVDTVILGCTHYPLVRSILQRALGRSVSLITSGAALARQAEHALGARDLATQRIVEGRYSFLCSGDPDAFRAAGTKFLQMPIDEVGLVSFPAASEVGPW